MLTQKELASRMMRLRAALDRNIENLNYGGCGVFAVSLAKALRKIGITEVEIILPDQWENGIAPREVYENGVKPSNMDRAHVGVRYRLRGKVYTADSTRVGLDKGSFGRSRWGSGPKTQARLGRNGAYEVKFSYPFGGGLTVEQFAPCTRVQRHWNRQFDRRQIPTLQALMDAYLVAGVK
jgi:hypothetical protein